jgi:hypothetical protein
MFDVGYFPPNTPPDLRAMGKPLMISSGLQAIRCGQDANNRRDKHCQDHNCEQFCPHFFLLLAAHWQMVGIYCG